jgi:esterase/lipase
MSNIRIKEEDVVFESAGRKLVGRVFKPCQPKKEAKLPAILVLHGWKLDNQESSFGFARDITENGFICFTFNFSGHAGSEGNIDTATRHDFLDDAINAYDYLSRIEQVDEKAITVIGSSLGGYLSMLLSAERKILSLVLKVPANAPDIVFDQQGTFFHASDEVLLWRKTIHEYSASKSLRALHNFQGKVLLFEAGMDEALPHEVLESYVRSVSDIKNLTYIMFGQATHIMYKDEVVGKQIQNICRDWMILNSM